MSDLKPEFLDQLVNDLKPGRFLPPGKRALWVGVGFTLVSIIAMLYVQAFREGFLQQILESPFFALEILSTIGITGYLAYYAFCQMVPGKTLNKKMKIVGGASTAIWLICLITSFFQSPLASSYLGARPLCVEEVLVHGLVGIGLFCFFLRKSHFQLRRRQYFIYGCLAGFIPGALMQVACLYSPLHGLLLHYFPAVIIGLIAAGVLPFLQRVLR